MSKKILKSEKTGKTPIGLEALSAREIEAIIYDQAVFYHSHGMFNTLMESYRFVNSVFNKMSDPIYRERFYSILNSIPTNGIRRNRSYTLSVFDNMSTYSSIWKKFTRAVYQKSTLRNAVHNAVDIFSSMDPNTSLTLNA